MFGLARLTSKCCSNSLTKIARSAVGNKNLFIAGVCNMSENFVGNKDELRKKLTPIQYHVTQEKGTERPFTGIYNKVYDEGLYTCIVCDQPLFSSDTKYDSSCGWPAFNDVLEQGKIKLTPDTSGAQTHISLFVFVMLFILSPINHSPAFYGFVFGPSSSSWHFIPSFLPSPIPFTPKVGANLLLLISQPGRIRTEVTCAKCGSHLGHVFNDGPPPTKKRFCINSASLNFTPKAGDS